MTSARQKRQERVNDVNRIIHEIAARGRKFFYHQRSGRTARFEITDTGRLRFRDEFTDCLIDVSKSTRWREFSGGGTLQQIVYALGRYVSKSEKVDPRHFGPWAQWRCEGDVWGYGYDEMEALRRAIAGNACLATLAPHQDGTAVEGQSHVSA